MYIDLLFLNLRQKVNKAHLKKVTESGKDKK